MKLALSPRILPPAIAKLLLFVIPEGIATPEATIPASPLSELSLIFTFTFPAAGFLSVGLEAPGLLSFPFF